MFLRTEIASEKKLLGKRVSMSFVNNKTFLLWNSFMPRLKEIQNKKGGELFSLEVYESFSATDFNPEKEFDKWACVEVTNYDVVPAEMETLTVPQGLYAVFLHKGPASEGEKTYRYIFQTWLPESEFIVDSRPHFAVMGEKYKNNSTDNEEEIWIPVKAK